MDGRNPQSRRDVLKTAAAMGATGMVTSMAGCQQVKSALGLGPNRTTKLPEDAEGAMFVDMNAVLNDEATKTLANAIIDKQKQQPGYDGPSDYEEARQKFEEESELELKKSKWTLTFWGYSEQGAGQTNGALFKGTWETDAVVDAMKKGNKGVEYSEEEYKGKTVYEPDSKYANALGVLSNNEYVSAKLDVVETVIEVQKGEEDPMAKELRKGYGSTSGPIRYISRMPPSANFDETGGGDSKVDLSPLADVVYVSGSISKNGDKRVSKTTMMGEDKSNAEDVKEALDGYFSLVEQQDTTSELVKNIVENIKVEQKGKKVVMTYSATVSELEDMVNKAMSSSQALFQLGPAGN